MIKRQSLAFILFSLLTFPAIADTQVNVVGLFNNRALVMINGDGPTNMRAGQVKGDVKLISATSSAAIFMIAGSRRTLKMGQAASVGGGNAASAEGAVNSPVHLYADSRSHYYGTLSINGASLKYMIDSGATTVALNSGDAKYAKIDYTKGKKVKVSTANGVVSAYSVMINTLKIGTIVLNNVRASVLEGGSPSVVLLGMSAQRRLNMKQENSVLTLTKKY